jgi:hypothetical protein
MAITNPYIGSVPESSDLGYLPKGLKGKDDGQLSREDAMMLRASGPLVARQRDRRGLKGEKHEDL